MGVLLKVTSQPLELIRMSEGGRLVSSNDLQAEERRLLARRMAFGLRYGSGGAGQSIPIKDRSDIRRAFSAGSGRRHVSPRRREAADLENGMNLPDSANESFSRYQTERGAFELRVHRGDLTFVPPLVMTIITQYPEVQFEYTGGFNYVPPSSAPNGTLLDLTG